MKKYKVITAALAAFAMSVIGCVCAGAYSVQPILANENKTTVWIFAGIVAVAAIGGVVYFFISNKKK